MMSTCWYGLHPPVTSLSVAPRPGGKVFDVVVWLKEEHAGRVIVRLEELEGFLDLFIDRRRVIVFQSFCGSPAWVGPEDFYGQVISDDYATTVVIRDDYIMERAQHLWKVKPIIQNQLLQKNNGGDQWRKLK